MTQMRKIIAQRMIESRRTSAHVHCMFEVDLTRIVNLRNKLKNSFEQRYGARLTFMGVPTPNLSDGSMNFHGKKEWVPLEWMDAAVETLLHLTDIWVERSRE